MNKARFLKLLNSSDQEDFNLLYDELLAYASSKSRGLPVDATLAAVSKVYDLIADDQAIYSWFHATKIINNALTDLRRKQARGQGLIPFALHPLHISHFVDIYSGDFDEAGNETISENPTFGWQGYYLLDTHGYRGRSEHPLTDRERQICKMYWELNMEQHEIAKELDIDKRRVSEVINRHKAPLKPDTRDSITSGIYPAIEP